MILLAILLALFASAIASPFLVRAFSRRLVGSYAGLVLSLTPLAAFVWMLTTDARPRETYAWVPTLGIELTLELDGLARLLALLVLGVGTLVLWYASAYFVKEQRIARLYAPLMVFMAAMVGLGLAQDVISLFVFWEITSIASYFLIGFDHDAPQSRRAAKIALLVTGGGGLCLLAGFLLLAEVAGVGYDLDGLAAAAPAVHGAAAYSAIAILLLLGAFTKSAQFPFSFWLPNAMAAPTPISAYLHSATMVKAGIFLLVRLDAVMASTLLWTHALVWTGGVTAVLASVAALRETDLKRILAQTTVAALGAMTLLIGLGGERGIFAALLLMVVHGLYKATLFLGAGIVDKVTGTREVTELRGLFRVLPVPAIGVVAASVSIAGIPLSLGFVGKEIVYKAALSHPELAWFAATSMAIMGAVGTYVGISFGATLWFGSPAKVQPKGHAGPLLWIGPLVLGLMGMAGGVFPSLFQPMIDEAVGAVGSDARSTAMLRWFGANAALLLSGVSLLAGIALARLAPRWRRKQKGAGRGPIAERAFDLGLEAVLAACQRVGRSVVSTTLSRDLLTVAATALGLGLAGMLTAGGLIEVSAVDVSLPSVWQILLVALIAAAALGAALSRSRVAVASALGVVGFGIALLFVSLGAPDVAMTQLLVETLIVLVIVFIMRRLPAIERLESRWRRARDAALAIGMGAFVSALLLAVTSKPFPQELTRQLTDRSVPDGHGRNVVNVILVDFRAFDTLGEIMVLGIAAVGALSLLRAAKSGEVPR